MMGYHMDKKFNKNFIVFEHLKKGNLHDFLHKSIKKIKLDKILFLKDLASVFQYIHESRFVHRDIKSFNILLTNAFKPKIIDFGLSRSFEEIQAGNYSDTSTPAYAAPEIFLKNQISEKVDIYAFGILLWEIMTHSIPFDGLPPQDIRKRCLSGKIPNPNLLRSDISNIYRLCTHKNAQKRPSFKEIKGKLEKLK